MEMAAEGGMSIGTSTNTSRWQVKWDSARTRVGQRVEEVRQVWEVIAIGKDLKLLIANAVSFPVDQGAPVRVASEHWKSSRRLR